MSVESATLLDEVIALRRDLAIERECNRRLSEAQGASIQEVLGDIREALCGIEANTNGMAHSLGTLANGPIR